MTAASRFDRSRPASVSAWSRCRRVGLGGMTVPEHVKKMVTPEP